MKSRIASIMKAKSLDSSITGCQTFNLSELDLVSHLEFQLPINLRLGHLIERIVAELIRSSTKYKLLYENIQIIEDKKTIGEIDFIIQDENTKQCIHLELAYKFYLYDPSISVEPINNWIGPNRNDSLKEKLEKLKTKQFPILYHDCTATLLNTLAIHEVSQALCFLVSLFIPFDYQGIYHPVFQKAIKGYYINVETFKSLNSVDKTYYLPIKTEWGIDPTENETWTDFNDVVKYIYLSIKQKQSPLCWQKHKNSYLQFFIVWW
ncbi:hypothetical protein SAMN05444396_103258 [Flavobacterium segetis]|uniref:DUF1853 domain-containing protein n=1 Tax=Flavobacterium segetis TaxID=271157 RepID=A0A1M5G446_9FLAO|nr:DUF1853 family protein [Flavobacterium segetis]SHF98489.1 hypothetical protein SAMN05444396_103258 [Flavobacterium segetis]